MYSYMLQAAEERLCKKCANASKKEAAPSSSTSTMDTDDLPPAAPSLASTSSPYTTTPLSLPSSPPSTVTSTDTPEEPSFSSPLQNPNPLVISTTSIGDGAAVATADALPFFPILLEVSSSTFPMAPLDASSSPVPSSNLEIPSASSTPHSPSSFSFEPHVFPADNVPSPNNVLVTSSTSCFHFTRGKYIPSSSPSPLELPPTLPPRQENISPSPETLSSYPLPPSILALPYPLFLLPLLLLHPLPSKNGKFPFQGK